MGKAEFTQLQNWMTQRDFNAWAIQTGPFAAHSVPFALKNIHFFQIILGSHFLLSQRANNGKKGIHPTPESEDTEGF